MNFNVYNTKRDLIQRNTLNHSEYLHFDIIHTFDSQNSIELLPKQLESNKKSIWIFPAGLIAKPTGALVEQGRAKMAAKRHGTSNVSWAFAPKPHVIDFRAFSLHGKGWVMNWLVFVLLWLN